MRTLLCFALALGILSAQACPPQYDLMEGKCIRVLIADVAAVKNIDTYRAECGKDNAHLPIIKNEEENDIFNNIGNSMDHINNGPYLILDLICNTSTHRLEWADGTAATWNPGNHDLFGNLDCVRSPETAVSRVTYNDWVSQALTNSYEEDTVLCVYDQQTTATVNPPSSQECPPQYDLMEGICIRVLVADVAAICNLETYRAECGKDNAHLPIIKNRKENMIFNKIGNSLGEWVGLMLDLVCNSSTRQVEWVDGTAVTWNPGNYDLFDDLDCVRSPTTALSLTAKDQWILQALVNDFEENTVLCVYDQPTTSTVKPPTSTTNISTSAAPTSSTAAKTSTSTTSNTSTTSKPATSPIDARCGNYFLMDVLTDNKPCFKIFTDILSWEQAQKRCAMDFAALLTINTGEENKYFWRTAIANNLLDGMHIGAYLSIDSSQWSWIDGEVQIGGKVYDNFAPFFPVPGGGNCVSMMTDSTNALWINENCNLNYQPFMCRRADYSSMPKDCPTVAPIAGEDFYPPGFPNPDTQCGYFLVVGAGKLVELEVITLIAEDSKDFLEILEGTSGPHLIANLTGTILSTTKFTTVESNVMRVIWKPNGAGNGRGFRIRYNEVGE